MKLRNPAGPTLGRVLSILSSLACPCLAWAAQLPVAEATQAAQAAQSAQATQAALGTPGTQATNGTTSKAASKPQAASKPATPTQAACKGSSCPRVIVQAGRYNLETRYAHSLPEVNGTTITVTKKTSVVDLNDMPTVIDNDQREVFDQLPGIVIAEQQNPTELNISYRGLGNPQESEYILLMQDGIPLELDWIGYPTTYYLPVPQTLGSVQMIRGGSGLTYGPEPEPVVNFISQPPDPNRAVAGTLEQVGGTYGLFSSFDRISGTSGDWDYLADYSRRQSDGQRENGEYALDSGDVHLGYRIDSEQKLSFDAHVYDLDSGLAGLMSGAQFQANPNQTTTPDDHLWTGRDTAILTYEAQFTPRDLYTQKLWTGYTDLVTRTDMYPEALVARGSTLAGQRFHYTGLDGRWLHRWGRGNALTVGYTAYTSRSPYNEWDSANPLVGMDDESGKLIYADGRSTKYGAVFAESVFRLPDRFHVVTSARFDREELTTQETVATHPSLVNGTYTKNAPLLGVGIGNDFGRGNETYLNVSQGFRPLRYLDIASPFSNFSPTNNPETTRYLTYEAGVHGWPILGLYYDVSLFDVEVKNRIESEQVSYLETIDVNTGSTRNRGAELEGSYDLLQLTSTSATSEHLSLFANGSLLDAHFTSSIIAGQVGKIPAYAPHYVLKTGLIWREDSRYKVSLFLDTVGSEYFQDSDEPVSSLGPGGQSVVATPALIPTYTVLDFAADYTLADHWRLLAGVSNLTDRRYYSRVFLAGGLLEPADALAAYAGIAYDL
jgi:Fe(3+) dicitrate transport protein